MRFHTAHELTVLAHQPTAYRRLGTLVARATGRPLRPVLARYGALFMAALRVPSTPARHAGVLERMVRHVSNDLTPDVRRELLEAITDHRRGLVPLVVPLALVRYHVRRLGIEGLRGQTYLGPHPKELLAPAPGVGTSPP